MFPPVAMLVEIGSNTSMQTPDVAEAIRRNFRHRWPPDMPAPTRHTRGVLGRSQSWAWLPPSSNNLRSGQGGPRRGRAGLRTRPARYPGRLVRISLDAAERDYATHSQFIGCKDEFWPHLVGSPEAPALVTDSPPVFAEVGPNRTVKIPGSARWGYRSSAGGATVHSPSQFIIKLATDFRASPILDLPITSTFEADLFDRLAAGADPATALRTCQIERLAS